MVPEDIVNARFNPSRGIKLPGYDQDEVDDFLDEVVYYLRSLEASNEFTEPPFSIADKKFSPTKWREGYKQDEVDDFLKQIEESIEARRKEASQKKKNELTQEAPAVILETPVSIISTDEKTDRIIHILLGDFGYVTDEKRAEVKSIIES